MHSLDGLVDQLNISVLLPDIVFDSRYVLFLDVGVNLSNLRDIDSFDLAWTVDLVIYLELWAVSCIVRSVSDDYRLVLHLKFY